MKTDSAKEPDVVRVVRCKDCMFAMDLPDWQKPLYVDGCKVCGIGRGLQRCGMCVVLPNDFCNDGKKEYEEGEHETN